MRKSSMLDALFPRVRQIVLAALLIQPERRWYLSDLAQYLHVQPSSLQRELASLTDVGILRREQDGNRVYYQAEPAFPLLAELQSIFIKTTGLADHIQQALEPFLNQIDFAFIYGSIARGERTARSDVDLMIIGSLGLADLAMPMRDLERTVGIPVNVTTFTWPEFLEKWTQGNHFLRTIVAERKIFVKGSENELANAVSGPEDQDALHEQA